MDQLVIKEFDLVDSEQNNPKMLFLIWLIFFPYLLTLVYSSCKPKKKKNDWSGTKLKYKQDWPFRRKAECFQIAVELWSQIQKTNWVSSPQEKAIRLFFVFFSFVSNSHTLKLEQYPWWWQMKNFQILN